LEQYMEIQQTDTARIEELVREATAGAGGTIRAGDGSALSDPNECVICHRVLSCRSALLMHYRTHTGERPYRCRLCGRTFTTKGNLKTHMAVHRGRIAGLAAATSQHRCRVCHRDFPGSVALQQHIRSAHLPDVTAPSTAGPFPFPANGAGGGAAATAAAAMMMMPGVNPLLPFFNFPSFYQAPRNLLVGSATSNGSATARAATQDHMDHGVGGGELDLRRKSSSADRDAEDYSSRPDVDDQVEPATKRVKTEDAGSDADGRRQNDVVALTRSVNGSLSDYPSDYPVFYPVTNDDDESNSLRDGQTANTTEDSERSKELPVLGVDVASSDNAGSSTSREHTSTATTTTAAVDDNLNTFSDRIASKFASPLLALEERVNSLDYSTSMFSRISIAAAGTSKDQEEDFGDGCGEPEQDRSSMVHDLRTHDYGLRLSMADDSYARADQQLMATSPSAQRVLMPGQLDGDVGSEDDASSPSPGGTVRPGSSGSGASSSLSGCAVPPTVTDHSDVGIAIQSPSKMSDSMPTRFSCTVCAKPFASASALEIHSRTHSGDRPFVCHVCSKAFTTKGNLKVHMSTHAWNKCPSRRGRRMTVVDPAAAAAVAAASGAFSSSLTAPKDAAVAAATAAAFLSNTFRPGVRFDGAMPPPSPMFGGFVPPHPGLPGNGAFLSDNKALLSYCMQMAAHGAGREGMTSDAVRQAVSATAAVGDWSSGTAPWMIGGGALKDERNNNGRAGAPMGQREEGVGGGGELDLSARSGGSSAGVTVSSFADRQTSAGIRSWTSERSSSLPLISNCT